MPLTRAQRSAAAASTLSVAFDVPGEEQSVLKVTKRKAPATSTKPGPATKKKAKQSSPVSAPLPDVEPDLHPDIKVIPATLSFDFEAAKAHLIQADPRFKTLFERLKCGPFENLETLEPFQSLTKAILGQQISVSAARSINYRFLRLFNTHLPEVADPSNRGTFPTPQQVLGTDVASLRSAGLSGRKADYVIDLARHFADGRLSAEKLTTLPDDELEKALVAVYGIGKWTVHMFAMFSLRRPDIVAPGDLGLQRGLLSWVLASHTGKHLTISPKEVAKQGKTPDIDSAVDRPVLTENTITSVSKDINEKDVSSILPAPISAAPLQPAEDAEKTQGDGVVLIPPPPTAIELPSGLSLATLKQRSEGKAKVKSGVYLTPVEFDFLTKDWAPYRSLGSYFMWALADEKPAKK